MVSTLEVELNGVSGCECEHTTEKRSHVPNIDPTTRTKSFTSTSISQRTGTTNTWNPKKVLTANMSVIKSPRAQRSGTSSHITTIDCALA